MWLDFSIHFHDIIIEYRFTSFGYVFFLKSYKYIKYKKKIDCSHEYAWYDDILNFLLFHIK